MQDNCRYVLETIQDFLCKLSLKPHMQLQEIINFSLKHVIVRPTKNIKDLCKANSIYVLALERSLIILVDLTMTCFSEKMMISYNCIRGFMPNLYKKTWMVSSTYLLQC